MFKKPILLHYFITNRCNARCQFCDIWKNKPKIDAQTDHVIANLSDAKKLGCKFVDFTGGEPLLHEDLPIYLKKAKKHGFITSVTTNALLFPERARELSGLIDLLHFSIDADTPEMNNKIHGCDTFTSVMVSIDIALNNNLVPDLLFTYTNDNIDFFSGLISIAAKKRIMIILDPVFNIEGKDMVSQKTHKKAIKLSKSAGVYMNKAHIVLRNEGGNNVHKPRCRAVSSTLVILPDNRLALPCYHHQLETLELKDSLFKAINHPDRLSAIKEQGAHFFCEGCHINCYFDPSFAYTINNLFIKSITAKISYALQKYFIYRRPIPRKHSSL